MGASYSCTDPTDDVILLHSTSSLNQPPLPQPLAVGGDQGRYDLRYRHHRPYDRSAGATGAGGEGDRAAPGRNLDTYAACPSRTSSVPATGGGGARGAAQSSPGVYQDENIYRRNKKRKSLVGRFLPGRAGGRRRRLRRKKKKPSMPLSGECRHDEVYHYPSHADGHCPPQQKHSLPRGRSSKRGDSRNHEGRYAGEDGRGDRSASGEEGHSHLDAALMGGLMTSGGGGVRNFLLMTGERGAAPAAAASPAGIDGRVGGDGIKVAAGATVTMPMPIKTRTKLFYRDPCHLERFGFDVTDEATVAGRQVYAARVAVIPVNRNGGNCDDGDDDDDGGNGDEEERVGIEASPGLVEDDDGSGSLPPPPTESRTLIRKGSSSNAGSVSHSPHAAEVVTDDASLLLLPSSPADQIDFNIASTKKRGMSWSFPTKRSKRGEGRSCRAHSNDGRRRARGGASSSCSCLYDDESGSFYRNTSCPHHGDVSAYRDGYPNTSKCSRSHPLHRYRCQDVPPYPLGCASFLFSREAVRNNKAAPVTDIACVDEENRIYVADIGLMPQDCRSIINVTERCSRGAYSAYTYAKQTLGCREHDDVAAVCVGPVMTASATIMDKLEATTTDTKYEETDGAGRDDSGKDAANDDEDSGNDDDVMAEQPMQERRPDPKPTARGRRKRDLVLDDREPHLVKYDVSKKERQKLDMHTDKSEWTFLISLSEGCGADFEGGGTYFECIDSTVHLSRGQALIFPGKLRHRGQKITSGRRFLLVGFLVDKNEEMKKAAPKTTATSAPVQVRGAPMPN